MTSEIDSLAGDAATEAGVRSAFICAAQSDPLEESKAVVDGLWVCDGRWVEAEGELEARKVYQTAFLGAPAVVCPAQSHPERGEHVYSLSGDRVVDRLA